MRWYDEKPELLVLTGATRAHRSYSSSLRLSRWRSSPWRIPSLSYCITELQAQYTLPDEQGSPWSITPSAAINEWSFGATNAAG